MNLSSKKYLITLLGFFFVYPGAPSAGEGHDSPQLRIIPPDRVIRNIAPYPYLTGGSFDKSGTDNSPDPLTGYRWDNPDSFDDLQVYYLKPLSAEASNADMSENAGSLLTDAPRVTIMGTGSIMLDFGVECAGWLEIDSPDLAGKVRMSISEYNEPGIVNEGAQSPEKTKEPVQHGVTYRLELNDQLYEGVRFAWIHVDEFDRPWSIMGVRLVCQAKPVNYAGSFSAGDPLLERIWYTGAYTVRLNLLKDYFGAILMERSDRHSWTGDAHTSQAASLVAFGNYDFVRMNIGRTADISNGIESYSLYWILSLIDYYMYSGDRDAFTGFIPQALAKIEHADSVSGGGYPLGFSGWDERLGAGFENPDCAENLTNFKMLFIRTCREFARALRHSGEEARADRIEVFGEKWASETTRNPDWYLGLEIHSSAEAINAGVTAEETHDAIFFQYFVNPADRISFSPFNQYFILKAMARMARHNEALETINRSWGGQIRLGATTFWEVYRPDWNLILNANAPLPNCQCGYTSLCHPWGSGVTQWISEEVLGIKPLMPGFEKVGIFPHPGGLSSLGGTMPTPRGGISFRIDIDSGKCIFQIPPGIQAEVGIPKCGREIRGISMHGKELWNGAYIPIPAIRDASENRDYIVLSGAEPGKYDLQITYSGKALPEKAQDDSPAAALSEEEMTGGNWRGRYGKEGYVLLSQNGAGSHEQRLPVYIHSIDIGKGKKVGVPMDTVIAAGTKDARAPESPVIGEDMRTCGALATRNPRPCFQTFTVDVISDGTKSFTTSLYFVDWSRDGIRQAVEVFDYDTKCLLYPTALIEDFGGGKYVSFSSQKSFRIRIYHLRGAQAVLNGLFFDETSAL